MRRGAGLAPVLAGIRRDVRLGTFYNDVPHYNSYTKQLSSGQSYKHDELHKPSPLGEGAYEALLVVRLYRITVAESTRSHEPSSDILCHIASGFSH